MPGIVSRSGCACRERSAECHVSNTGIHNMQPDTPTAAIGHQWGHPMAMAMADRTTHSHIMAELVPKNKRGRDAMLVAVAVARFAGRDYDLRFRQEYCRAVVACRYFAYEYVVVSGL